MIIYNKNSLQTGSSFSLSSSTQDTAEKKSSFKKQSSNTKLKHKSIKKQHTELLNKANCEFLQSLGYQLK